MLVLTRYRVSDVATEAFTRDADAAMTTLTRCPGFMHGWLGHNADDPELWTLTLVWRDVGSYRRALSTYDVKVAAVPLLSRALDEPSAYVTVERWGGAGPPGSLSRS